MNDLTRAAPPTLLDLRRHLTDHGMTQWYLPSRLEFLADMRRNATGKVQRHLLRSWLNGAELGNVT
jgi:cyclohexanecarboxylate-CoA ligase